MVIAKRYNKDAYRLIDENELVVGFALALANGRWGAYDGGDKRVTPKSFANPKEVAAWYNTNPTLHPLMIF